MIPGYPYRPEDYLWMAWRRRWGILVPFLAVAIPTAVATKFLPDQYRSETLILVVPQRVPESYVRSTVTAPIQDRLRSISQQILSRTRLEQVIQDFDLYPEERRQLAMEDVVGRMRGQIRVETVRGDAFRVTYVSDDPQKAMQVTERLASMFIEENLRDREVLAEGTNQFLEGELEDARQRLIEREKQLEAYRQRHAGQLPSQLQSNLQVMQSSQMQLQALRESINRDHDRRFVLERGIVEGPSAELQQLLLGAPVEAGPSGTMPGATAAQQLRAARDELQALQARLKAEHPDVVRMKRLIEDLEQKAEAEAREKPPSADMAELTPAEIATQSRVRGMQAELDSLDRQIAQKEQEERRLQEVIAAYQRRVEAVPTRESELAELTRDYDTLQKIYSGLLAKKADSRIAANLERRQIGEQFKVLDPARLPERPFSPNRQRLNLMGAFAGLGLGLLLAGFLEYRDSSFRTEEEALACLALPVLAMIPAMITEPERRLKRRKLILSGLGGLLVVTGAAVAAAWRFGLLTLDLVK